MLELSQMVIRLVIALGLGAVMGLERELIGKEAGIRTNMLVAGGAALFSMIGLTLPYLVSTGAENIPEVVARNSGFLSVIANIVVGIGFLGGGIILKAEGRVRGLTTAATVWATAGIGILAGVGLTRFAVAATILIAGLLYLLRNVEVSKYKDQLEA